MREELDKQLCERYPKIFANRNGHMRETLMCFGFEHGDGWFNILNEMCGEIQHYLNWKNKTAPTVEQVVAVQVKEKFGGLRFYYEGGDDYVRGVVDMATSMTRHTCEECGNVGQLRSGGWLRVLCDEHANGREVAKNEF